MEALSPTPSPAPSPALSPEMEADLVPESAAPSSVSLARKWRPRNFADIVGQEYVVDAVRRAARRHHAYLFSGTRGVGKTTLARVLAMLLNCQDENAEDPCGKCPNCRDIAAGKFTAVMELDAASLKSGSGDTQVGQIRELMDEMAYAPAQGRFRVLIMDEVHALGAGPKAAAFNPLLKTLEEPPPHARFILATTDPQRLPATVPLPLPVLFAFAHPARRHRRAPGDDTQGGNIPLRTTPSPKSPGWGAAACATRFPSWTKSPTAAKPWPPPACGESSARPASPSWPIFCAPSPTAAPPTR